LGLELTRGGAKKIFSLLQLNSGSSIIRIPLVEFELYGMLFIPPFLADVKIGPVLAVPIKTLY
jgi:hypothetical protein